MDRKTRFMRHVFFDTSERGCWLWTGAIDGLGKYGLFFDTNRRCFDRAHRVSWEIHAGNIPDSLCVLHHCDNGICVRPEHLFLGTKTENNRDRDRKCRQAVGNRCGNSILNPNLVKVIRSMTKPRTGAISISKKLNLPFGAVKGVVDRRTWNHIT